MTLKNLHKAPWPWFGGKADAAPLVWAALGDPDNYIEPFAGSLAVLLLRPHVANRTYHDETVNDLDGLLVNAWRSIQMSPVETARAASWPVSEADMHARHLALVKWRNEQRLEHLMGDPLWHDPVMAGWWSWGQSCWIGSGWASGVGAWTVDDNGRIKKSSNGTGVNRSRPNVHSNRGVNNPCVRSIGASLSSMTEPELLRWFAFLSARLRHVRILNGGWERAVTSGVTHTISVRNGGVCGVFLDPPYADVAKRASNLYALDSLSVAHEVRKWAIEAGRDRKMRIVIAGFDVEHKDLENHGWTVAEWFRSGFFKGGMGKEQHRERLWMSPHCEPLHKATTSPASQPSLFCEDQCIP